MQLSTDRTLILQGNYCVGDRDVKEHAAHANDLMVKKPYMTSKVSFSSNNTRTATVDILLSRIHPDKRTWDMFGNDGLVAVMATVMHGSSQAPLRAFTALEI
jgi:hypothetical protein